MEIWHRLAQVLEVDESNIDSALDRLLEAVSRDPDNPKSLEAFGDLTSECIGELSNRIQEVSLPGIISMTISNLSSAVSL